MAVTWNGDLPVAMLELYLNYEVSTTREPGHNKHIVPENNCRTPYKTFLRYPLKIKT